MDYDKARRELDGARGLINHRGGNPLGEVELVKAEALVDIAESLKQLVNNDLADLGLGFIPEYTLEATPELDDLETDMVPGVWVEHNEDEGTPHRIARTGLSEGEQWITLDLGEADDGSRSEGGKVWARDFHVVNEPEPDEKGTGAAGDFGAGELTDDIDADFGSSTAREPKLVKAKKHKS